MANLPDIVSKSTDGLYRISFDGVKINLLRRRITFTNVVIRADTNRYNQLVLAHRAPANLYSLRLSFVTAGGINWIAVIRNQLFDCKHVHISYPEVFILNRPTGDVIEAKSNSDRPFIERIQIGKIEVDGAKVDYLHSDSLGEFRVFLNGGRSTLMHWVYNPKQTDDTSFFMSKSGLISVDTFAYTRAGDVYSIVSNGIEFNSSQNSLSVTGLKIGPVVSREAFYKKAVSQKEIYNMSFPSIHVKGFDWQRMLNNRTLVIAEMDMSEPSLEIYLSRLYPPTTLSKVGNYPHQLIRKLGLPLLVSTLRLANGHLKYTEMNETTNKEGVITFEKVNATINNATNIDSLIQSNSECVASLNGLFMNEALVSVKMSLLLADLKGAFSVDGVASDIEAADINQAAIALALTEVTSFNLKRMELHVEGNETYATGNFIMTYDDLAVSILKRGDDNRKKKKGAVSFLANSLALYPSNPMPGENVRQAEVRLIRDPYKGFFALIWKSIFMGAEKTALRKGGNTIEKMKNSAHAKPGNKPGLLKLLFQKRK